MAAQNFPVLIADDNELNRWLFCEQLQQWTTDITAAKEGREAWQLLEDRKYSLIFLDLNMPFFNGLDLIKKIRATEAPNQLTPVIAVTAHTYGQQRQTLIDCGFNDCLFKPILLYHIMQVIEQWLLFSAKEPSPAYYAEQVVKKTEDNRELSRCLLNKLFSEVPTYLRDIAQAQQQLDFQQAWQIAHKLQGTFCFYGFEDFLVMAENLAEKLLNKDARAASVQLQAIELKFSTLSNHRHAILANVSGALQDS